jgi:hypothetical protein
MIISKNVNLLEFKLHKKKLKKANHRIFFRGLSDLPVIPNPC